MHLFGSIGTVMFFIGLFASIWVGAQKLWSIAQGERSILVTDSPYFYIALATMIIGTQLFMTGFLAELLSRSAKDRNVYLVEKHCGDL